jgi:hypothetical protein
VWQDAAILPVFSTSKNASVVVRLANPAMLQVQGEVAVGGESIMKRMRRVFLLLILVLIAIAPLFAATRGGR